MQSLGFAVQQLGCHHVVVCLQSVQSVSSPKMLSMVQHDQLCQKILNLRYIPGMTECSCMHISLYTVGLVLEKAAKGAIIVFPSEPKQVELRSCFKYVSTCCVVM